MPRKSSLDSLRNLIEEETGEKLLWGNDDDLVIKLLPLGIASIDAMLGGGIAFDRITEVYGEEAAGKTLLAQFALKAALAAGLPAVYLDIERRWNPEWADALGLDPAKVLVVSPRTGEKAFDVLHKTIGTEPGGVIVLDSLAAMTANAEIDDGTDMSQQFVGLHARMTNRGIRQIATFNNGWAVILVNQIRINVGQRYGNPETMPGGKGQKFYANVIIRVRRAGWIKEGSKTDGKRIGYNYRLIAEKSGMTEPYREVTVPFYFEGGIDELAVTLEIAIALGIIKKKGGGYYEFEDTRVRGMKGLREAAHADDALMAAITAAIEGQEEEQF